MKRAMFGILAVVVMCAVSVLPAAAQQGERNVEINAFGGRSSGSVEGMSFPKGAAFGVDFEYALIQGRLTTGMGFRHEGTGWASVNGSNVRVSRNSIDIFALRFYPLGQSRWFRPYGRFSVGYGSNKLHVGGGRSQSQNARITSVSGGIKLNVAPRWAIVPEISLASGGKQKNYYTGEKVGLGVRTTTFVVGVAYCLSCSQ